MTDVAALDFQVRSDGVATAADRLDRLKMASEKAEATTIRLSGAFGRADPAVDRLAQSAAKARAACDPLAASLGAADRAAQAVAGGLGRAGAAAEKAGGQAQAAARHFDALHDEMQRDFVGTYVAATRRVEAATAGAGKAAGFAGHEMVNLGRQMGDVATMAAMGASPMAILSTQGFQLAEIFGVARARGVSLTAALGQMAATVGRLVLPFAPLLAGLGAAAAAFLLWKKHAEETKAALEAAKKVASDFADTQGKVVDALGAAIEFTAKYGAESAGLTDALDKLLMSQNAAYRGALASADADDVAGKAALRRAEVERLKTLAILRSAAAEADARAGEAEKDAKKAAATASREGLFATIGRASLSAEMPMGEDVLAVGEAARLRKERELGVAATRAIAAEEREYAKVLRAQAVELKALNLVMPETKEQRAAAAAASRAAAAAEREAAKATKEAAREIEALDDAVRALLQRLETPAERALREYNEATMLLRKALDAGRISTDEFREAIDRLNPVIVEAAAAQEAFRGQLTKTPADLAKGVAAIDDAADAALADFLRMRHGWDAVFSDIRNRDWASAFAGLHRALKDVQAAFSETGTAADKMAAVSAIADAAGNIIGGRAGRALSSAGNAATTALVATGNPIVAGVAAAVAGLAELLRSKPSNEGAGLSLVTGQFTGKSRTADTERAARAAADAITRGQELLEDAGIRLGATVHGLVIGTRDLSQVYLTNGQTVTAAVGDAAAAAEAALVAVLRSATYIDDAQRRLVEGMLAAGKGFDDITAALETYAAAQKIGAALADEILRLTDPKAFDLKAVRDDIEAQRKAYADLTAEGYLTADQLAEINGQLAVLEGLRVDEVLRRYADATDAAADAAEAARRAADAAIEAAAGRTDEARQVLRDAYDREAAAIRAHVEEMDRAAASLRGFRRELEFGAVAGRGPVSQLEAMRREFDRLTALPADNAERLASLQPVGQAFISASRAASPTQLAFDRDLAAVRRAVEASATAAKGEADAGRAQIDALTAQVGQLVELNAGVKSVSAAMQDLKEALVALAVAQAQRDALVTGPVANENFDPDRYLAGNKDIRRYAEEHGLDARVFATEHWMGTGRYEEAAGLRKYATGGSFMVGGAGGTDSQLVQFWASPDERVDVLTPQQQQRGGGDAELRAEIRALRAEMRGMRDAAERTAETNREMNQRDKVREIRGVYVRGEAPGDPVEVAS